MFCMYCALFRIILERPSNIASTRTCSPETLVPFYSLHTKIKKKSNKGVWDILVHTAGVVEWCEGAVYLTSLGRPTDIGLQLGKACYPCSG